MYDLIPTFMKAQFNLINKPNQSIKLIVNIFDKSSKQKDLSKYTYNKIIIFKYLINIKNSHYELNIYQENTNVNHFNKTILGSFVYDISIKFSISQIIINADKDIDLHTLVYGFLRKDFIFSVYKKNSNKSEYITSFKLHKNLQSQLNSINFLKELVTEPSNIIYPISFAKRTHAEKNVPVPLVHPKPVHRHHCLVYSFCFVEVPNPQTDSFVQKTTALLAIGANPSSKIPACA